MKLLNYLFFCCCLVVPYSLKAQTTPPTTAYDQQGNFVQEMTTLFQNLDLSDVATGLLLDRT